jgi:hypothetical protein
MSRERLQELRSRARYEELKAKAGKKSEIPAADSSDSFGVKALDVAGKGLEQMSDLVVNGLDSLPGMSYLKKAQAAIAAPIKGQSYEDTIDGYNQDTDMRWERSPGASLTGAVLLGSKLPGASGLSTGSKTANALSRVGEAGLVSAVDSAGRGESGLNLDAATQGGATAGGVQAFFESLPVLNKAAKATGAFTRDKAGSIGFGVRGDATKEYLKNPEKMREVIDSGEDALLNLKNNVDDTYRSKVTEPLKEAKSGYDEAVMDYADQKARYKNSRPPEEIAPDIINHVKDLDKDLSEQSSKAFETLEGVGFDRQGLVDLVSDLKGRQMIDGKAPTMGDRLSSYNALEKVEKMINADPNLSRSTIDHVIKNSDLKAADLKMIIQAMQNEAESAFTTYGSRSAGGKIKNMSGVLNKQLKDTVPEYAKAMEPLALDTELVQGLKEIFPDEQTARAALRSTANPDTGRQVKMLLQSLDNRKGTQFSKMLEDYIEGQRMVRDPEAANVLKAFTLNPAKRALSSAEEQASKFSRLGQGSSENAIKSASRPKNFETKSQLSGLMGDDFLDSVNQYGLAQDFQKTSTNGSRKVNLGGIIGGPVGAVLGATNDIHGGKIWQSILDGQIKAAQLADKVAPEFRSILLQAEKSGPRALAAAYVAIQNKKK